MNDSNNYVHPYYREASRVVLIPSDVPVQWKVSMTLT